MSLKRKSIQTASRDKKRKVITLETKYEMIKLYEGGETINSISKKFDMSTSKAHLYRTVSVRFHSFRIKKCSFHLLKAWIK